MGGTLLETYSESFVKTSWRKSVFFLVKNECWTIRIECHRDDTLCELSNIQSVKKPVLCMLGLLSTIIRGRERSDQESVVNEKIALAHEHN